MITFWDWFNKIGAIGIALGGIITLWQILKNLSSISASAKMLIQHAPSIETVAKLAPLVEALTKEFRPNGGSSLRDKLVAQGVTLEHVQKITEEHTLVLNQQSKILEGQNRALEEIKIEVNKGFGSIAKHRTNDRAEDGRTIRE